ncbi:hypothetical protein IU433_19115 [Nocardia puris]|uniref:PPE family protein n=1 Tax=Nocardia puris TaxID=208602 RepID=A0A366DFR8_9NOCA|nr:hypothetical protein [Nocardia puris]MBF6211554.1 hypothetical protein [Nocardia puris]MBF6366806.1 hypothetical protein [Nocardia puris]MBF6461147.1 hypothetical protein [Nocardia puris]RBO88920.1 hypothetical protein DFR74_108145 [Nocardia puris]
MAGEGENPWVAFQEQAAAGKIDIGEGAARSAAGIVADSLTMMLIGKAATDRITEYQGFGNLPSGQTLRQRFLSVARDLDDRLAEDEKILRGMGEMFLIAGKIYEDTDESAAEQFETFRMDRFGNWQDTRRDFPGVPLRGEGTLPGWARELRSGTSGPHFPEGDRLPDPNSEVQPQTKGMGAIPVELVEKPNDSARDGDRWTGDPSIENAYAIEYTTFYELGQALGDHSQDVIDAAAVWNWISARLDVAFNDLANGIEQLHASGEWGGEGPQASLTAALTYRSNVLDLTSAVSSVGNNLSWTSGWLHTVKLNMPWQASWDGAGGTASVGKPYARDVLLPRARTAFNNFYVPGVQQSSSAIPPMPPPNKELLTVTPEETPGGPGPGPGPGPGLPIGPGPGPGYLDTRGLQQIAGPRDGARLDTERLQREQQEAAARQQQAAAQWQREQQEAARRQQEQQAREQAAEQARRAAEQAASAGEQAAQEAMSAAQQAAQGIPALGGLPTPSALDAARAAALNAAKGLGSGPGPGGAAPAARPVGDVGKLFPRAGVASGVTTGLAGAARAGIASMGPYPGPPGAAGAAGRNAGGEGKEHKRPAYLDSAEHLDEAVGEAPTAFKPVVDQ